MGLAMKTAIRSSIVSTRWAAVLGIAVLSIVIFCANGNVSYAQSAEVTTLNPVVENRGVMQQLEDTSITFRVNNLISENNQVMSKSEVNVTTVNGIVLLTGSVKNAQDKYWCEQVASSHPKVLKVINELKVRKQRSLLNIGRDKALQASVKFRIIRELDAESPTVHVVTYDKVVYLMGVVSKDVADRAANVASSTKKVDRVITIFQFKKDV